MTFQPHTTPIPDGYECLGRMAPDLPWIHLRWVASAARWWAPDHDCWIWPAELRPIGSDEHSHSDRNINNVELDKHFP